MEETEEINPEREADYVYKRDIAQHPGAPSPASILPAALPGKPQPTPGAPLDLAIQPARFPNRGATALCGFGFAADFFARNV